MGIAMLLIASIAMYLTFNFRYLILLAIIGIVLMALSAAAVYAHRYTRTVIFHWLAIGKGRVRLLQAAGLCWFLLFGRWASSEEKVSKEIAVTLLTTSLLVLVACIAESLIRHGRLRVMALLAGFVCIIGFYGSIYNLLFMARPLSFGFSREIAEGITIQRSFTDSLQELRELERRLYLATALEGVPRVGYDASRRSANTHEGIPLNRASSIRFILVPDPPGGDEPHLICKHNGTDFDLSAWGGRIHNPEHQLVASLYYAPTVEAFHARAQELLDVIHRKVEVLRASLEAVFAGRPEWNIVDFCYFSTITITTVGYGDILPNSSTVRMVVMSQAVFGMAYAAFGLALIRGD